MKPELKRKLENFRNSFTAELAEELPPEVITRICTAADELLYCVDLEIMKAERQRHANDRREYEPYDERFTDDAED